MFRIYSYWLTAIFRGAILNKLKSILDRNKVVIRCLKTYCVIVKWSITAINTIYSSKDTDQSKIHVLNERNQLEKEWALSDTK